MAGDLIQRGLDWLEGQRRRHRTVTVVYRRDGQETEIHDNTFIDVRQQGSGGNGGTSLLGG